VVSETGEILGERAVGQIEIAGPCVMKGYFQNPEATNAVLAPDGWLKTGDLGYLVAGELHIVGRIKDVVKKGGAKYDAADIQSLVSEVRGVRPGCVAAFAHENPARGSEDLVIIAETKAVSSTELDGLAEAVRKSISKTFGAAVDVLRFVPPGALEKTSSGKVRVQECRRKYLIGEMRIVWPREAQPE
jgi:acyl-CoA synthetase (AMP-forming)/AMP-acid ligase II